MKTLFTLLFTSLISTLSYGQIDENLIDANWKVGNEKIIYGNKVIRQEGDNYIGGVTNISYQTLEQIKADLEKMAEKQMWTPEKKKEMIDLYEKGSAGGQIKMYLSRLTIDAANTNMFTVIVKDSTDNNEIFRKELKSKIPSVPSSGSRYWTNYTSVILPEKISGKVFIYVVDKLGGDNHTKYKFEINL